MGEMVVVREAVRAHTAYAHNRPKPVLSEAGRKRGCEVVRTFEVSSASPWRCSIQRLMRRQAIRQ